MTNAQRGAGMYGRIKTIAGQSVRFTSRRQQSDGIHSWDGVVPPRSWTWRSVDDPRMFASGFRTMADAEAHALKTLNLN